MIRRRFMLVLIAVAVLVIPECVGGSVATAHDLPPDFAGGWVANDWRAPGGRTPPRPDGRPMTHFCGPTRFSINDHGNSGVGEVFRNGVWAMHLASGHQFVEVPFGQPVAFELHWAEPGGGRGAYTRMESDGWNYTFGRTQISPSRYSGENLKFLWPTTLHELMHVAGVGHPPPLPHRDSVITTIRTDGSGFTFLDQVALATLWDHHDPFPGRLCWPVR